MCTGLALAVAAQGSGPTRGPLLQSIFAYCIKQVCAVLFYHWLDENPSHEIVKYCQLKIVLLTAVYFFRSRKLLPHSHELSGQLRQQHAV